MKVYYFTIMAIGIMFLFGMLGIETMSNSILSNLGTPDNWNNSYIWLAIGFAIAAFGATITKINSGFVSFQVTSESVVAALIGSIYLIFAADLYSIVSYVYSITVDSPTTLWIYYVVWAIIVPLLVGYGISVIEFIRGTD